MPIVAGETSASESVSNTIETVSSSCRFSPVHSCSERLRLLSADTSASIHSDCSVGPSRQIHVRAVYCERERVHRIVPPASLMHIRVRIDTGILVMLESNARARTLSALWIVDTSTPSTQPAYPERYATSSAGSSSA